MLILTLKNEANTVLRSLATGPYAAVQQSIRKVQRQAEKPLQAPKKEVQKNGKIARAMAGALEGVSKVLLVVRLSLSKPESRSIDGNDHRLTTGRVQEMNKD